MITLTLILMAICIVVLVVLAIAGLLAIFWPLAIILGVGILIDCLVLKKLIDRK